MKKFLLSCCLALGAGAYAQVDVTSSGGTTTASYTTVKGAFDKINDGTHTGSIVLSISGNTTETAQAALNASSGTASYTSVLIKPTVAATISGSISANALINLAGATNVTIDGSITAGGTTKDLILSNTNTSTSASVVRFINGASNNTVKNTVIRGVATGTSVGAVFFSTSTATLGNNNNIVSNNDITKGSTSNGVAVFNLGTSGKANTNNIVSGNRIFDFTTYGVFDSNFSNGFTILNNDIFLSAPIASSALTGIRPNSSGIVAPVYSGNKIRDLVTTTAAGTSIGINLFTIGAASNVLVSNNMISNLSGPTTGSGIVVGIYDQLDPGCTSYIYNNSVVISGAITGTSGSYSYYRNYQNPSVVKNNIFVNTRTSTGGFIQSPFYNSNTAGTFTSDYNVIYNSGGSANITAIDLVGTTVTQFTTFDSFKANAVLAGREANSRGVQPIFVSASDLHLVANDIRNGNLSNWGTSLPEVLVDIDGDTRSATPDVGADEFAYVLPTSLPTCAVLSYPANNAVDVPSNAVVTWATVANAEKYKVFIGTTPGGSEIVNGAEVTVTSYTLNLLSKQTYYLRVIANNTLGDATGCSEIQFTTTYCAPRTTAPTAVTPILSVNFSGVTKSSDTGVTTGGTYAPYENFTTTEFVVKSDVTSVPLTVNGVAIGTTNGWGMAAYVDWNDDGDFDDAGEQYFNTAATMLRVVGGTPVVVTGNITIPSGVSFGKKRMRVKYNFTNAALNLVFVTACNDLTNGQAEDYIIDYQDATLAVSDSNKSNVALYPNPFTDVLKISDVKGVKSVSISDVSGRLVKTVKATAEIQVSELKTGLYIVNLHMEDGSVKSIKAIKK